MANSRVILDTDILIDLLRNKPEARITVAEMEKKLLIATTTVNVYELFFGAHKSSQKEKSLQSTCTLLRRLPILPLTSKAAQEAGRIMAVLEAEGQSIGLGDVFIAAIAITKGFSLVTGNCEHFKRIDGLSIINP
jgi:tRNA(fMet)-specific endonuclease VapC